MKFGLLLSVGAVLLSAVPAHAGYVGNDPINFTDPTGMCTYDADGNASSGICPMPGDDAASALVDDRLSDSNSIAGQVESQLNDAGLITFVDTTQVSSAADSVMVAGPDASFLDGTAEGVRHATGEVWIGTETDTTSVIGTMAGSSLEGPIPFTVTEAFEHEFSHVADALNGLGNQNASGVIAASGATVSVMRGGVDHGAGEARAVNRTNQFRERSGLDRQRTRY
ncbi:MAG: hypothetical protein ABNH53_01335 [Henriciella sp.]|jgi:hypothetical protein